MIHAHVVQEENSSNATEVCSGLPQQTVDVVVGVIWNKAGHVLLAKRRYDVHCGDLWEFPGGKIEPGETTLAALKRELFEEVGIVVHHADYLFTLPHHYPQKPVCLYIHDVVDYQQEPYGKEGQEVRWVAPNTLPTYRFPRANEAIVATVMQYHALRYST